MSTFTRLGMRECGWNSVQQMVLKCITFTWLYQSMNVDHPVILEQIFSCCCIDLIFWWCDVWDLLALIQAPFSIFNDSYWPPWMSCWQPAVGRKAQHATERWTCAIDHVQGKYLASWRKDRNVEGSERHNDHMRVYWFFFSSSVTEIRYCLQIST